MSTPWFDPLWFAATCLGGGGLLLSLWVGLVPPVVSRLARVAEALLMLLGCVSGVGAAWAFTADQPLPIWGSAALLASLDLLLVVFPSKAFALACGSLVALLQTRLGRRTAMLGLWALCPFAALGLAYAHFDTVDLVGDEAFLNAHAAPVFVPQPDSVSVLTTDRGRPVQTLHVDGMTAAPSPETLAEQAVLIQRFDLSEEVIQLPIGWENTNCHGFVFTGGHFCLGGEQVERILEDNGYEAVSSAQAGDVAIYRDDTGLILHSGIVRGLASDGVILVESKWGQIGRFIHRHDRHVYAGAECTFYRSHRQGHLLRGVFPSTPLPDTHPSANEPPLRPSAEVGL